MPATSARNLTPTSTAAAVGLGRVGRVPRWTVQIEHGQVGGGVPAAVVNDHVVAVAMVLPARSLAPLTVAVYVVPAASAAVGVNVAFWLALS